MKSVIAYAVVAAVAGLLGAGAPALGSGRAPASGEAQTSTVTVRVGDVVRLAGGAIGCMVKRQAGERVFDCRRAGGLAGTYGTTFGKLTVRVVRFRSNRVGEIVLSAKHGGAATCCR